ncbi:MAG: DsbC family protein [Nitrosomonadales bacterium]|nr:DsbC family protein [Nitrosomonadales bacterium]
MKKLSALFLFFAMMVSAHAGEKEIRQSLQSNFPGLGKIEHVIKTPYSGLYEIVVDGQLLYADEKGQYLFEGDVIDTKTRRNMSEERRRVVFAIDFDKLSLELAVKRVKGNGKRKMAVFTDPHCGFCKKLEKELSRVTDVTIYRFMYPIFPGSDEIVRNVLCSKDPNKAWEDWMLSEINPAPATCDTQTDKVKALGQKLRVTGTPNLIFGNGMQTPGYLPAEELEKSLNQARK